MEVCGFPLEEQLKPHAVHSRPLRAVEWRKANNESVIAEALREYFFIGVVRDPWERVVSGYYDKFVTNGAAVWADAVREQVRPADNPDRTSPLTFEETVKYVVET